MIRLRAYCPEGAHLPVEVIASIPEDLDPDRIGIVVYGTGAPSNRWADGAVGVSDEQAALADEDESPTCPVHKSQCLWVLDDQEGGQ